VSPTDYARLAGQATVTAVLAPIVAIGTVIVVTQRQPNDLQVGWLIFHVAVVCWIHLVATTIAMRNCVQAVHPNPTEVQKDQFPDLVRRHFGPARCDFVLGGQMALLSLIPLLALLFNDPSGRWIAVVALPFLFLSAHAIRHGLKQPRPNCQEMSV